jgi:hypothetical protein
VINWSVEGERLGGSLRKLSTIVVLGVDSTDTALVALGIARSQSASRRVTVVDLFGDSPPIRALVTTDDPHGIVDSFVYGVSLKRITHRVPEPGELYVVTAGTEPPTYPDLFGHSRWPRIVESARKVGELLVVIAPASAPGLERLVTLSDGAVVVGGFTPTRVPEQRILAVVSESGRGRRGMTPESAPVSGEPAHAPGNYRKTPRGSIVVSPAESNEPAATSGVTGNRTAFAGVLITVAVAAFLVWLAGRPFSWGPGKGSRPAPVADSTGTRAVTAAGLHPVSDSTLTPRDSGSIVANQSDSAGAAAFSIQLMSANTQPGAILTFQAERGTLPAATFTPVLIGDTRWYRVICGALATRAAADSLLASLKTARGARAKDWIVMETPYAFLIDSAVPASAAKALTAELARQGVPAYALYQEDGTAWILAGAFENVAQSTLYGELLGALPGLGAGGPRGPPTLVFRKGKM